MTREEKFKGIIERLKEKDVDFDPIHVSAMVIIGYLDELQKLGLIESAFTINPSGKAVKDICEEFDWKPTDEEVKAFVIEMIDKQDRAAFTHIVRQYRDDREKFLAEFEEFKKTDKGDKE